MAACRAAIGSDHVRRSDGDGGRPAPLLEYRRSLQATQQMDINLR
jgi:hypothetical protein